MPMRKDKCLLSVKKTLKPECSIHPPAEKRPWVRAQMPAARGGLLHVSVDVEHSNSKWGCLHERVSFYRGVWGGEERMVYLWISWRSQWNTIPSAPMRHLTLRYQVMVSAADIPRAGLTACGWPCGDCPRVSGLFQRLSSPNLSPIQLAQRWGQPQLPRRPHGQLGQPCSDDTHQILSEPSSSTTAASYKRLVLVLPNHVFWSKTWRKFGTSQESWIVGLLLHNSWVQMLAIGVQGCSTVSKWWYAFNVLLQGTIITRGRKRICIFRILQLIWLFSLH